MTTIAFRDGILAADTQINSCNGCVAGYMQKIGKTSLGMWAFSGEAQRQEACVEWANGTRADDPPKWEEGGVFILFEAGKVREWWGSGWLESTADFFAWGSGERMARAAMLAGANAQAAVEIASQLDSDTGGEISTLRTHLAKKEAA